MSKIPDNYKGVGYGTVYDDGMIRQAIAIAEVFNALGVGGGGGGTGGATEATLTQVRNRLPLTLGQKVLAESLSVAIASDQQLSLVNDPVNRIFVNATPPNLIVPPRIAKETTSEEGLINAPGVGLKLLIHRVVAYNLSPTAEQTIILVSSDGTFPYPSMIVAAKDKDGFADSSAPWFELAENTALRVSQSSATLVHYSVQYRVVEV
jgi:hypothetical protein